MIDLEGEVDRNTVIAGDFNTPLTSMDRSSRQKINKETTALNYTIDKMDLIDVFRVFHPESAEGQVHMECFLDHILGPKNSLNKFKKIEIISSIFSDHNAMKLEINHKNNTEKLAKTWKLNSMLFNTAVSLLIFLSGRSIL